MMTEDEFIKGVWERYEKTKQIKEKCICKKSKKMNFLKEVAVFLIFAIGLTGIGYAGVEVYQYIQNRVSPNFEKNVNYDYSQDMEYGEGFYYKQVLSYEEYQIYKNRWNDLLEMSKEDFENEFMVIIALESTSLNGAEINSIEVEGEILKIELEKKNKSNEENSIISVKIGKQMYKKQIEVLMKK